MLCKRHFPAVSPSILDMKELLIQFLDVLPKLLAALVISLVGLLPSALLFIATWWLRRRTKVLSPNLVVSSWALAIALWSVAGGFLVVMIPNVLSAMEVDMDYRVWMRWAFGTILVLLFIFAPAVLLFIGFGIASIIDRLSSSRSP